RMRKPPVRNGILRHPSSCLGSMGIYIFETRELSRRLKAAAARAGSSHDFGKDVIPSMIAEVPGYAHQFVDRDGGAEPYWRDVGTLDAYYEANMDLCAVAPRFNLYDVDLPIHY